VLAIKSPGHATSPKAVEPLDPALQELERTLEGTGATALLRGQRNEEVAKENLERTMYNLDNVTEDLVGKLKRVPWRAPQWDVGVSHYRSQQVKRPMVGGPGAVGHAKGHGPVPGVTPGPGATSSSDQLAVCGTYTGRMCFYTGCLKGCVGCDPCGEGTSSQVWPPCSVEARSHNSPGLEPCPLLTHDVPRVFLYGTHAAVRPPTHCAAPFLVPCPMLCAVSVARDRWTFWACSTHATCASSSLWAGSAWLRP
jgi:hypothetical protein